MLTAFVTGDLFIVLPTLIERCRQLLREHAQPEEGASDAPEVIVPAFYNFPHAAKVLSLSTTGPSSATCRLTRLSVASM